MAQKTNHKDISVLLEIMVALRTPVTGCPWDLEQTFQTIAPYTIEEAYEVADAIQHGNMKALKEELGDLLLQVVYHSRIAEESGHFNFEDVIEAISHKMIRRHPHVFGTEDERAAGVEPGFWERIKADEKAEKKDAPSSNASEDMFESILDHVPLGLPALTRAVKLQKKAARVGFDWPEFSAVWDKLNEELAEFEHEISKLSETKCANSEERKRIEEEYGDLLFVLANIARHLKIDPEAALRKANSKFIRRFHEIEKGLAARGRKPEESTLEEMDNLWEDVKQKEKASGCDP